MKRFATILIGFLFLSCLAFFSWSDQENLDVLIEKGEALIRQKSYPAGIAVLETVLTKDEKNTRALYSLLSAYDVYTTELASQNRFEQVNQYLPKMEALVAKIRILPQDGSAGFNVSESRIKREVASAKSYMADPEGKQAQELIKLNTGRERYNEAVAQFKKRQYELAENLLKESIELDPSNAFAYELLGEIANLSHRLEDAEVYYKQAFSLNSDPRVRTKYEKIEKEKNLDQEQQQYSDEHFIIRYKRSEDIAGSKIRDVLRDAYRAISQDFGYYPKYKIPVILYDREEYQNVAGSIPHWSAALYDGKIRLPVYEQQNINLKKLVFHELTHAFVLDLSQMKCPIWLNEGLAQFQENKVQAIDLRRLSDAVRNKTLISMDQLVFMDVSKISDQDQAILFYLEAYSFTSFLVKERGFYRVKRLLLELAKGALFPEAFETAFGRSFKDLAGEWQRDLERSQR